MGIDGSEVLRQRGLRVTAQRLAVFRAVSDAPHVTADVVAETVRGEIGSISVQAVYDPPCLTAVEDFGYEIDEAEVIYWGRCPECVATPSAAGDQRSKGTV